MKYLAALGISVMLLLALISPTITVNFWQKVLYNREESKEQKKKDLEVSLIICSVLTVVLFVYVIFWGEL